MAKKFKIYTLGCKVNQYDSGVLAGKLKAAGFLLVKNNASLAIVNTCAVTQTAIRKGRKMVVKARKENPKARIIITGCWPKVYKEAGYGNEKSVVVVRNEKELEKISGFSGRDMGSRNKADGGGPVKDDEVMPCTKVISANDRARYSIKIQDGCEQFCSYCIIPYARGKMKSRLMDEVLEEIKTAVEKGYREVVLCGIHLGLYGKDFKNKKLGTGGRTRNVNLAGLLKKAAEIKNLGRVRLSSIEITEVSDELIKLMADYTRQADAKKSGAKICRHLHIPLQSGSDKILKLMNRPYAAAYFRKRARAIRKKLPDIALTTDVITGFPGETEKDFKETYNFIREMKFSRLHVFPFSAHEKTPAARLPFRVPEEIKSERAAKLKSLGEKMALDYKNKFRGRSLFVVIENKRKGEWLLGKTEYYFDVVFTEKNIPDAVKIDSKRLAGKIAKVKYWK
ncbi:MAG: tRNA (N(6)-L-threonylcarbamoyladenosine(37)-C(2))-methylthiotransferase MtaB [Patescibacteria group bacterium]|jgi:threonylcarbamoyladenosine tRNA methylthiotransferase MtaB